MIGTTFILLIFAGSNAGVCVCSALRLLRQYQGEQQYTLSGEPIPWWVWALFIFVGLLGIAASIPAMLGNPLWLLDKVFYFFTLFQ